LSERSCTRIEWDNNKVVELENCSSARRRVKGTTG
jgi:hypothetical protein